MFKKLLIGGAAIVASLITAAGVTFAQTASSSPSASPSASPSSSSSVTVPSAAPSTGMGGAAL